MIGFIPAVVAAPARGERGLSPPRFGLSPPDSIENPEFFKIRCLKYEALRAEPPQIFFSKGSAPQESKTWRRRYPAATKFTEKPGV